MWRCSSHVPELDLLPTRQSDPLKEIPMTASDPYHAGERTVQQRVGVEHIANRLARSIGSSLPDAARPLLEAQSHVFVAARAGEQGVWAGVLAGDPGFTHALDPWTIRIDALPAEHDPLHGVLTRRRIDVGLLVLEPRTRRRLRINGTAAPRDGGLVVRTAQVYANCPKYIQRRLAAPAARASAPPAARRADRLGADDIALVRRSDTFVIATAALDGSADASHRGGSPGFVVVDGDRRLAFGDYAGNSMFNTLGNLELDPRAGLVFVEPGTGDVLQLTGRAAVDWDPRRAASFPGAERVVDVVVHELVRAERAVPPLGAVIERSPHNPPAP
jgi:uncharacterized protein